MGIPLDKLIDMEDEKKTQDSADGLTVYKNVYEATCVAIKEAAILSAQAVRERNAGLEPSVKDKLVSAALDRVLNEQVEYSTVESDN